jgi:beta-glucanase (GH16 family)
MDMRAIHMLALTSCLIAFSARAEPASTADGDDASWALVWSDEFDGTKLDRTKWRPEKSCWGGGNEERQCYTDRQKNILVANGQLHLIAREERFRGQSQPAEIAEKINPMISQPFTSGKVRTRGIASWKYGKIEFRAKPPKGQGTWPAVWMMPANSDYGPWPLSGEIDILEGVNLGARCDSCTGGVGENRMNSAIHFGDLPPANVFLDQKVALPSGALISDDFHIWTLEWGKGVMRFYLDHKKYWEVTAKQWRTGSLKARSNSFAPFDKPFFIMANLAIGGRFSEENNDMGVSKGVTPAELAIDWIRIYQCNIDRETGLACMKGVDRDK